MVNLRKAAKGQMCQIRIPGYCNHNPETSVLAHYRLAGTCGTATKPHDMQSPVRFWSVRHRGVHQSSGL